MKEQQKSDVISTWRTVPPLPLLAGAFVGVLYMALVMPPTHHKIGLSREFEVLVQDVQQVLNSNTTESDKVHALSVLLLKPCTGPIVHLQKHLQSIIDSQISDGDKVEAFTYIVSEQQGHNGLDSKVSSAAALSQQIVPTQNDSSQSKVPHLRTDSKSTRFCTPEQLRSELVSQNNSSMAQWPKRKYDFRCRTIGRNYRCPGRQDYLDFLANDENRQVPKDAANGECTLSEPVGLYPYPSGSRVLYIGNSHMREIIHAIRCQFGEAKANVTGTNQDTACKLQDYKIEADKDEILFAVHYENNSSAYGVCNCGLMYNRTTAFRDVSGLLQMDIGTLTHVVANPSNNAKWAVQWKYNKCANEPFQTLANLSNSELFTWNPFPDAMSLRRALEKHGFRGRLIWTLPFWCFNNSRANRYRYDIPKNLLDSDAVDGVIDFSDFICPNPKYRCDTTGCSKGSAGSHQCLPGPPDDIAANVLHLIATLPL